MKIVITEYFFDHDNVMMNDIGNIMSIIINK